MNVLEWGFNYSIHRTEKRMISRNAAPRGGGVGYGFPP
nr:MAG TPA: hypothetical protein [Bacteriophage sp.]